MGGVFCKATATSAARRISYLAVGLALTLFYCERRARREPRKKMAISSTNNAFSNNTKMLSELDPGGARGYTTLHTRTAGGGTYISCKKHINTPPTLVRGRQTLFIMHIQNLLFDQKAWALVLRPPCQETCLRAPRARREPARKIWNAI